MKSSRLGQAFIISAPSGTGKSTLVRMLLKEFPELAFSVSCTTRAPRQGEVPGVDYHFLEVEEFTRLREQGHFAEWAEVHGNYYGTPRQAVIERLDKGEDVLFDIDVQGAMQLRENLGLGAYLFLLPPSRAALAQRLGKRGTDSAETIARRLDNALGEIRQAERFDYLVVNDDLDKAYDELRAVYLAGRLAASRNPGLVGDLLGHWEESGRG